MKQYPRWLVMEIPEGQILAEIAKPSLFYGDSAQAEATARLIAASPQLAAACQAAWSAIDGGYADQSTLAQLRAALEAAAVSP